MTESPRALNTPMEMPDFAATYRSHVTYVWNSLARLGVRTADREDLAHDVFVAALRHWHDFDATRPVEPWLFGIAFRTVLHFNRRRRAHADVAEVPEPVDAKPGPDEVLATAQALALAAHALAGLALDRRAVFVMHDIDGHAMPEIAEALGVPLNTAYSRLRLARRDFNVAAEALRREEAHHA